MTERIDLTVPVPAQPARNNYIVDELHFQRAGQRIDIWLLADNGERQFVHMTTRCTTVGSAFHGYWGRGQLGSFVQVEAC